MNRLIVIAAAITSVFASATSAQEEACRSVLWTRGTNGPGSGIVREMAPVDYDQDGKLDLVGAGHNPSDLVWWKGEGDGTFRTRSSIRQGESMPGALSVVVADVTGDGRSDVIAMHRTPFRFFSDREDLLILPATGLGGAPRSSSRS